MTTFQVISSAPPSTGRDTEQFQSSRACSRELWRGATELLAGGVSHTNRRTYPHPIFYERSRGARKWDVDGNEYVDYNLGSASLLLGHAHPEVVEAVQRRAALGTPPMCHSQELDWAALVQELIPSAELIRFLASGSEATMLGMRVARAVTGRDSIVRLEGHFHGWHDYVMRGYREPFGDSVSSGVPDPVADTVRTAAASDPVTGVACHLEAGDVAAVILEPSGATWGTVPLGFDALRELRALCDRHGTLLIFDEVITGFRFSPGGVQAAADVTPDLTSLGKTLTGGLPGGALVGRADLMDAFRPGRESNQPYVFHFGTFNGHPLTASAGVATLKCIRTGEPHRLADAYAARLRTGIQTAIDELGIRGLAYPAERRSAIVSPGKILSSFARPDSRGRLSPRIYFCGLIANNSCPYSIGALFATSSSRSLLPRPTRFHSSTSWLPRCTESGRLQRCLRASRKAGIRAKAIRRTCPRSGERTMCSPSSGAGGAATGAEGPAGGLGSRRNAEFRSRRRRRLPVRSARPQRRPGYSRGSPPDPHFDISALQLKLGDVFLN